MKRFVPPFKVGRRKVAPSHARRTSWEMPTMRSARSLYGSAYRYQLSSLYTSYGNPQMGDLFNDIMGAVVPKWDQRPDWMKKIQVKPDPLKIAEQAAKVVPPKELGRVVDQAAKYGVNLAYKTPAGSVPITGQMVAGGYRNLPMIASFSRAFSDIPTWAYVAGGIGAVLVIMTVAKK